MKYKENKNPGTVFEVKLLKKKIQNISQHLCRKPRNTILKSNKREHSGPANM